MIRKLLLLAFTAVSLSGCVLFYFPPSLTSSNEPDLTRLVSPAPDEAIFYGIGYSESSPVYPTATPPEARRFGNRSVSVNSADDDYAKTWQSIGQSSAGFLTIDDVDFTYPEGGTGKRRVVRLKATAESPGVKGANPSFTGIRQASPSASYSSRIMYKPRKNGDRAGVLAWQDHQHYLFCGVTLVDGKPVAVLVRRDPGVESPDGIVQATRPLTTKSFDRLGFSVSIANGVLTCYVTEGKDKLAMVGQSHDAFGTSIASPADEGMLIGAHAYSPAP